MANSDQSVFKLVIPDESTWLGRSPSGFPFVSHSLQHLSPEEPTAARWEFEKLQAISYLAIT